jgi:hypothetical protein
MEEKIKLYNFSKESCVLRKTLAIVASAALFVLLYDCSNPVDEQLRWSSKTEVPVTNEKFSFIEEINNIYKDDTGTVSIIDPDSTKKGDILRVRNRQHRNIVVDISDDSIETQTAVAVIGPVPVSSSATFGDTVSLAAPAGVFSSTIPLTIPYVYEITFYDTATNLLSVKIDNISASVLNNVSVGIAGVDTQQVASIAAGASATIKLEARGKRVSKTAQVYFTGEAASAGVKSLGLTFSLNGLLIGSCKASDSLVQFSHSVRATYDITDTVALDYVDIKAGIFIYKVENQSRLRLKVSLAHEHVWLTDFCRKNNLERVSDLRSMSAGDSSTNFMGNVLLNTQDATIQPNSNGEVARLNLASYRLFGVWDAARGEAVTSAVYTLQTQKPRGDTIEFSAGDSLKYTLACGNFKFDEFLGTVMVPYTRAADTQKVAINLPKPMNATMKDSLRNHVLLSLVNGDVTCTTKTNDRAFIDTMKVSFKAFAMGYPAASDSSTVRFLNVCKDSIFKRSINITKVANQYPDTVIITSSVLVPKGTRMRACNSHPDAEGIGKMTITMGTKYDFLSSIDWTVLLPTYLDLGGSRFSVMDPLRFIKKLESRQVSMFLKMRNNSNMHMRLYSLIAPRKLIDTLDSMSTNDFVKLAMSKDSSEKRGYVNFFGSTGVYLPQRKDTVPVENMVILNHNQLETILNSDTCSWRWLARLEAQPRDSLMDTDFVDLRSKLRVEGVNSVDSVLQW